ncbi:MAG: glycerophosphodiester phosphodiesterase family protein [Ardenticatenaceae bacterium]|nr:glycerophosphodiester phosphodiesterase family protein [Ardenticatenaceae bacterium]
MKSKLTKIIAFIALFVGLHLFFRSRPLTTPKLISHRGAGKLAPENTLVGIEAAMAHGADLIEVDVQRSRDGVLFLMHDKSVNRTTTGRGAIKDMTAAEIRQLDAGIYFSPTFAGEPVPTLNEALELTKGHPATLVIELKNPELYSNIEVEVAELVKSHQMEDQVMVVSFNRESLKKMETLLPGVSLGAVSTYPLEVTGPPQIQATGAFWLFVLLDPTLVSRLHQHDVEVWIWTINHPLLIRFMLWFGVDGVTTDRPDHWRG